MNTYIAKSRENLERIKSELSGISLTYPAIPKFPKEYSDCRIKPSSLHPRVMTNNSLMADVKKKLNMEENLPVFEQVREIADSALSGSGTLPNTAPNFSTEQLGVLEALGFMYLATGEEIYGYAAALHTLNYISGIKFFKDQDIYSLTAYHENNKAGAAFFILSEVFDWCYDFFTSEQRDAVIRGTLKNVAPIMEIGCPPRFGCTVSGHASECVILRNWLAFSIAVYNEYPEIYECIAGRILNEYVHGVNWFLKSGVHHQGSAYGTTPRLYPHIVCDMLMTAATGEHIYDISFEPVIMTILNRVRPDGESIRIGDDYNCDAVKYSMYDVYSIAFFGGSYYKNPTAKAWSMMCKQSFGYGGHCTKTPITYLLFNDPEVVPSEADTYNFELIHYNGSPSGSVVCRSRWNDKNAWLTYTNIEEAYAANHDHKDAGTFQIYYKGILAPDAGVYDYAYHSQKMPPEHLYGSVLDVAYAKQTISKNGLLIYNPAIQGVGNWIYSGGQRTYQNGINGENITFGLWLSKSTSKQAKILAHAECAEKDSFGYCYLSGDITNAYDNETVRLVMRSTISLPTNDSEHPLLFMVHDRITSKDESFKKVFVLHTTDKPIFYGGDAQSSDDEYTRITGAKSYYYTNTRGPAGAYAEDFRDGKHNGKLTVTTLLPECAEHAYIGGDGHRFWVNGKNMGKEGDPTLTNASEIGWGRIETSPTEKNLTDSFLHVMYVGDAENELGEPTSCGLIPSTLIKSDTHEGAIAFGSCVMFPKTNERYDTDISFDTSCISGELNYYVTGLEAGTWCCSIDGVKALVNVKEESGLAVFSGKSGVVSISKKK